MFGDWEDLNATVVYVGLFVLLREFNIYTGVTCEGLAFFRRRLWIVTHYDIYICKSTIWMCKLIVSRNVRLIINSYAVFIWMSPKLFKTKNFNLKKVALVTTKRACNSYLCHVHCVSTNTVVSQNAVQTPMKSLSRGPPA